MTWKYQSYDNYKDSGAVWLGKIPSHWKASRLGKFFIERREKVSDKEYPALSVTMQGIVPQIETAAKSDDGDNRKLVLKNDFVINSRSDRKGSSGVSALNGSVSLISIVLTPVNIHPPFIHHLFRSYPFQEEFYRYGKGITADLWSTNSTEMKNILIPEISHDEQIQIANFLSYETLKIDSLIERQQEFVKLLNEKRQSVITNLVISGLNPNSPMKDAGTPWLKKVPANWDRSLIKNLCFVNDGNHGEEYPSESDFVDMQNGVPFLTAGDFDKFKIKRDNIKYISIEKNSSMRKGNLQENDILFVNRGSTIGKLCLVDKFFSGANLNSQIAYLRPNSSLINPRFLLYFLASSYIQTKILAAIHGGAMPQYPLKHILNLDILCPSLKEQAEIAQTLDDRTNKLDHMIEQSENAISLLFERREALISAAVTGRIDVRNWQPPKQNENQPQDNKEVTA